MIKCLLNMFEYTDVFGKDAADRLTSHGLFDCAIDLIDDAVPKYNRMYRYSATELEIMKKQIKEDLARQFIRSSKSSAVSPVLFVSKKDGSMKMCVDYRSLNQITVRNHYPIPPMLGLLEQLQGACVFTQIDLRNVYRLLRIRKNDEWKTAFRTPFGVYEYLVLPFGLINAPEAFQEMINSTLRTFWTD